MELSPPKKKKRIASCHYREQWERDFRFTGWLTKSMLGSTHVYCRVCNRDIRVDHGGMNDVTKHSVTAIHLKNQKAQNNTNSASVFFVKKENDDVFRAEVLFSNFVAEHNLSFNVADHFTRLCKLMFPDSKIAIKFSCGRTKTTQIIKRAIVPELHDDVIHHLQTQPFSLACDESNDRNSDKSLAILVRYFTEQSTTKFLAMPICKIGTAANIFDHLQQVFM